MIFHLTSKKEWDHALQTGTYRAASLESDGFIHFSTFGQILKVANSFYQKYDDAVLLAVDNNQIRDFVWEGEEALEFPHLYRALNRSEVVKVIPLKKDSGGNFISDQDLHECAGAVTLETGRLKIREFLLTDLESVHSYASQMEVVKFMPWGPNTVKDTRAFFTRKFKEQCQKPRPNYDFAIEDKVTGEFLGSAGLLIKNFESGVANLGYILKKTAHGNGYATEFSKRLIEFGFQQLQLFRIEATCDSENIASFRVMQKIGMQKEGVLRGNQILRNRRRDTIVCAILKLGDAETL
jgi:RimJ/RimL family protein N-acetyltransferase